MGKVTAPCGQRCPGLLKDPKLLKTFQDLKIKVSSSFATIMILASSSSAAYPIKRPTTKVAQGTQQPQKPLGQVACPLAMDAPVQLTNEGEAPEFSATSSQDGRETQGKKQRIKTCTAPKSRSLRGVLQQCCVSKTRNSLSGGSDALWTTFGLR